MTSVCLAPLALAGYLFMALPHREHGANLNAPMLTLQTCERGLGVDLTATQSGLYTLMAQYGWRWQRHEWSVTVQPKAGGAYHDVMLLEEQSKLTFSLGLQVLVGYDRARVGLAYLHNSNAGLGARNAGLDLLTLSVGLTFDWP